MVFLVLFLIVFYLGIIAFYVIANWKFYEKAGQPGWACIVPIYQLIVLLEIAGKPTWWIVLMLIPGVNIIFYIMTMHGVSVNFGKDTGFTLGLIFLPFVFIPMLAFSKATVYLPLQNQGNAGSSPYNGDTYRREY